MLDGLRARAVRFFRLGMYSHGSVSLLVYLSLADQTQIMPFIEHLLGAGDWIGVADFLEYKIDAPLGDTSSTPEILLAEEKIVLMLAGASEG